MSATALARAGGSGRRGERATGKSGFSAPAPRAHWPSRPAPRPTRAHKYRVAARISSFLAHCSHAAHVFRVTL
ncbi:hypothetical protein RR46_15230 [Papilio xuthus]|uniref:Uncharacterized protein n=1 Tax=Papilio xuthus TaxID=66420 RepID=A0A194PEE6_PAPXU|nr:hypothetical protein RR46_15230 [Papilio xuthus]